MARNIRINLDKVNKLQIGCSKDHFPQSEGWANLDMSDACKPDILHNLVDGLPMFKDSSLDVVVANGVMEQIEFDKDFEFLLREIHRVLKPNGILSGQVPSTDPRVMHYDPKDKRFFQKDSFNYFDHRQNAWKQFGEQYGYPKFEVDYAEPNDNGIMIFQMRAYK